MVHSHFDWLRTVPPKYAPGWDHVEKVDLCTGFWNSQRKIRVATHFFEIISLNPNKNADISIFLKKEEKDISSQIYLEFAFTYRKVNTLKKIFKLHGKWLHENHSWYIFDLTNRMWFYHNIKDNERNLFQDLLTTRTWKCTRCIMQMSYLYASDFPFNYFCTLNMQKQ